MKGLIASTLLSCAIIFSSEFTLAKPLYLSTLTAQDGGTVCGGTVDFVFGISCFLMFLTDYNTYGVL